MKYNAIATLAAISAPAMVSAASGTLKVLTVNVGGDGNGVTGDKTINAQTIGTRISENKYDVVNIQSDFTHHDSIYQTDDHAHRTTASSDGLNTMSSLPFTDFRRVKWNKCSNAEGGDCDTPKGFTFMRTRLADGVYIDMYNLQTDGGIQADDTAARSDNIVQLSEYIKTWSGGNAVMVFGDTNSLFSRTGDKIRILNDDNGMSDAWLSLVRKDDASADVTCENPSGTLKCELGDKVFSRGSSVLTLDANAFEYVGKTFAGTGSVLTDRDPVQVSLTWTQSETLRQSDIFGTSLGQSWFNDAPEIATKSTRPKASKIAFSGNERVDKVSVTLDDGTSFEHGGGGGDMKEITLAADEYWTTIDICQATGESNNRIVYVKATATGEKWVEVGRTSTSCQKYSAPNGFQIVGFVGQVGDEIDQLGVVYGLR
ncbi:Sphingomyelinase [Ceratocystis fimbriata CBS 114723]|uniref:Sphingomyelinase n=1 Tax=Ceratocystis fimbriata CBS 114723 TaxID=1035309 RepID=A0A2C5W4A2_9PEZI|nr:Sphingomyelinase [Ceratocystis fimbriata CBS 114723]